MSKFLDEMMQSHHVRPEQIHLPTGGVAVFGRSGTGKSSLFYHSRFVGAVIVADTGSLAHKLFARGEVTVIDPTADTSPIEQVKAVVETCHRAGTLFLLDSFTTLQESQVAWWKRGGKAGKGPAVHLKDHQTIVGHMRDLALTLALAQGFTIFNTTPGGTGRTPEGAEIRFPAGAITGYPSLSGVGAGSETVLARWGCVWGVFQGYQDIPRGLYVPGQDIRPEQHAVYSPLKDPLMVIRDTTDGKKIHAAPDLRDPANGGRSFVDELLVSVAAKYPKKSAAPPKPAEKGDALAAPEKAAVRK